VRIISGSGDAPRFLSKNSSGLGKVIPPHLVAFIAEDLVADRTGQHVELGMWDVFRRKLGVCDDLVVQKRRDSQLLRMNCHRYRFTPHARIAFGAALADTAEAVRRWVALRCESP